MRSSAHSAIRHDPMGLRTFIAIDIPLAIQKSILEKIEILNDEINSPSIRWIGAQNLHVTLKYLGETREDQLGNLKNSINEFARSVTPFDIVVKGLGSFPNPKRARVLYFGIQAPAELEALYLEVESACRGIGFPKENRPFSPHLTIGRVRDHIPATEKDKIHEVLNNIKIDSLGKASVDSVHLYKSQLKPTGAVYTKIFTVPFKEVNSENT